MQPVSKILEIDRGFEGRLKELGRFENRRIKINLNVNLKKLKNLINSVINLYNFRSIWFSLLVHDSEISFFFFNQFCENFKNKIK